MMHMAHQMFLLLVAGCLAATVFLGCAPTQPEPPRDTAASTTGTDASRVVFLTRAGCVNTPVMRNHLDAAIEALDLPANYIVIDQGTLDTTDARRGYPTPTLLLDDRDLFGMPTPVKPFAAPS